MSTQLSQDVVIIVIDDDKTMRRACQAALRHTEYQVETYADGPSGLTRIEETGADLLVVDLKMPGMSGMEVIERVKAIAPDIVTIVITGFATVSTAVEAMKAGAYDFIPKPFTVDEFRVIIARGVERCQLAQETRRLRREKEAQARKFITFVSHQLKSPLGAVQQYLDVLHHQAAGEIPERHLEWIARSRKKIVDMLQIIGDWLTISKVEGGQLVTDRIALRWQDLATDVLESCSSAAEDNRVTLHNDVPFDLPSIVGDATALRMMLSNLVGNAIKYNKPGGEVRVTGKADETEVSVSVSDTGPGISSENQEHVFEEFYRVGGAATAGKSGTGMGLPICRKIAEELGGRVTLTSRPGDGSTFTAVLPRAFDEMSASDRQTEQTS